MSSSILNWNPILTAWLKKRPSVMTEVLLPAFEGSFCGKTHYVVLYFFVQVCLYLGMSSNSISSVKQFWSFKFFLSFILISFSKNTCNQLLLRLNQLLQALCLSYHSNTEAVSMSFVSGSQQRIDCLSTR